MERQCPNAPVIAAHAAHTAVKRNSSTLARLPALNYGSRLPCLPRSVVSHAKTARRQCFAWLRPRTARRRGLRLARIRPTHSHAVGLRLTGSPGRIRTGMTRFRKPAHLRSATGPRNGKDGRHRTCNLRVQSPALCQLSYVPISCLQWSARLDSNQRKTGLEGRRIVLSATRACKRPVLSEFNYARGRSDFHTQFRPAWCPWLDSNQRCDLRRVTPAVPPQEQSVRRNPPIQRVS